MAFPGGTVLKNPPANAGGAGDVGSIPGLGRSLGEGNGNPLRYLCLENPHGQRSLVGYSSQGHKEWDTTQHSTAQCLEMYKRFSPWLGGGSFLEFHLLFYIPTGAEMEFTLEGPLSKI